MNRNRQIIVTTTPSLEGWEIQSYLGTIASHVVAGTNLFSDLFASLSDVFGGRSHTYQNQLSSINEEAIVLLRQKASELGSNCIVGLRIDHDEISGGGKSMFMVTAVGTAVKAKQLSNHQNGSSGNQLSNHQNGSGSLSEQQIISSEKLAILLRKKQIIEAASKDKLSVFNDDTWYFIVENHIHELAPAILNSIAMVLGQALESTFRNQIMRYFLNLPEEILKRYLFDALKSNADLISFVKEVIKEGNLLDFEDVKKFLDADDFNIQKLGLSLLELDKPFYRQQDIEILENFLLKIRSTEGFKVKATFSTEKATFLMKGKNKWICGCCGYENDEENLYCNGMDRKCSKDIYGFTDKEINPKQIENLLTKKIEILKEIFK